MKEQGKPFPGEVKLRDDRAWDVLIATGRNPHAFMLMHYEKDVAWFKDRNTRQYVSVSMAVADGEGDRVVSQLGRGNKC